MHKLALALAFLSPLYAGPGAPMPKAKYPFRVEVNVRVPMRDGVKLATDLYIPEGAGDKLPAIMIRTPYNRKNNTNPARIFAGQGYAVAVQDVRGKFDSEGHFTVSANDSNDGSDTLDWMAGQPWSTGKIGTYGCSYLAEDQYELAKLKNPHHTAMSRRPAVARSATPICWKAVRWAWPRPRRGFSSGEARSIRTQRRPKSISRRCF
jgi:predicted acyl esterase